MPYDPAIVRAGFAPFDPAATPQPEPQPAPVPPAPSMSEPQAWAELDPSLLEDRRVSLPPFPLQLLPFGWERWVAETAQAAGTPADYVAQGLLAAVAAVTGAGVAVRVTQGWSEPLVLWQALVGTPSSGKSPALAAVRRLVADIEAELRDGDGERRRRFDQKLEEARLLGDRWKERCAAAVAQGEAAPPKPEAACFDEAFVPHQIVVADATVEALADVVAGNPKGVVLWRDELAAWLANQGRYANGGSDRAHWLEAWSASGITINRRNRSAPLHLPRFPVSVVGTIQPDRIAEAFQGSDDGMAARFLYVWPEMAPHTPLLERRAPDDETALVRLQKIARLSASADAPLVLGFEIEAVLLLDRFLAELNSQARTLEGLEAGWVGKGAGTVVRLAGVLALLDWSERDGATAVPPGPIGREAAQQAIGLWIHYFRAHARGVFTQAGRADRDRHARRVVRWLQTMAVEEVSREQVRREALAHAVDAEGADKVIARLTAGGVLRLLPTPKGRGRPAKRWEVNPAMLG
jgi:hypothetical protein